MIGAMSRRFIPLLCLTLALLAACGPGRLPEQVTIALTSDGETQTLLMLQGSTVRDALRSASVTLAELDRVRPPETSLLTSGMAITVTRVIQSNEQITETIPFDSRTQLDTTLAPGEMRIAQAGRNGVSATDYRMTYEDGKLINRVAIRQETIATPMPEIIRTGPREDFSKIIVPGTLVFMSNNNAYVVRDTLGNKRALTTNGDLDAHVFSVSRDGQWLLYTRGNTSTLNSLWLVDTTLAQPDPQDLKLNGILWADFAPDGKSIAYSRAEPALGLPGWKALNDLTIAPFTNGKLGKGKEIMKASAAAPYAWWGTNFAWSPAGNMLAYANPGGIGVINPTAKITRTLPITNFTAYNTRANYAWVPTVSWSPDGKFLITQMHSPSPTGEAVEDSSAFDVVEMQVSGTLQMPLDALAGMWATPRWLGTTPADSQIIFGKAETHDASDTSRYFLYAMDRDGSNQRLLYPAKDQPGLRVLYDFLDFDVGPDGHSLVVVNQGNLYWLDLNNAEPRQLTTDGSISLPRWAR